MVISVCSYVVVGVGIRYQVKLCRFMFTRVYKLAIQLIHVEYSIDNCILPTYTKQKQLISNSSFTRLLLGARYMVLKKKLINAINKLVQEFFHLIKTFSIPFSSIFIISAESNLCVYKKEKK